MKNGLSTTRNPERTDFEILVEAICSVNQQLCVHAARAVNMSLTLRNWLFGMRIQEYEQNGSDRANYGERLIDMLAEKLQAAGVSRSESRELRRYRLFYQYYPQIRDSLTPEFCNLLPASNLGSPLPIRETVSPVSHAQYQLQLPDRESLQIQLQTERRRLEAEQADGNTNE